MLKRYGWKRKRKGPAKQGKTYSVPKGTRYSYRMIGYAAALRKKGFSKVYIIRFYQTIFGRDSPSTILISRWYNTRLYNPDAQSRASTPNSTPDTVILGSASESDDEGRAPFQQSPMTNHLPPYY